MALKPCYKPFRTIKSLLKFGLMGVFLFGVMILNVSADEGNFWTKKADIPNSANWTAGFSIGTKGYILLSGSKDFYEYDPSNNQWTKKADFGGVARYRSVGFSLGGKGYIGTGWTGAALLKDFWEYDPSNDSWTQKADFGGGLRREAVGFSIYNEVQGWRGFIGTGYDGGSLRVDFWEYMPSIDQWGQKANFTGTARADAVGFSIGEKGYIGTGLIGGYTKTFYEYDPSNDSWTQKADFGGSARCYAVGFSIPAREKGYIGTGHDGSDLKDFWEYDPSNNSWTQKADFGGAIRKNAVGFYVGEKGYLGGGNVDNEFWEYTPPPLPCSYWETPYDCQLAECCWYYSRYPEFNVCTDCPTECSGGSSYNCALCLTQETCEVYLPSCYWENGECKYTTAECGEGLLVLFCTTQETCEANGGYWYDDFCWTSPKTTLTSWEDYYNTNGEQETPTAFVDGLATAIGGFYSKIGGFLDTFNASFDLRGAYQRGNDFGSAIPVARGYLGIINSFCGNLPVGEFFMFILIFMLAVGVFRIVRNLIQLIKIF